MGVPRYRKSLRFGRLSCFLVKNLNFFGFQEGFYDDTFALSPGSNRRGAGARKRGKLVAIMVKMS